MAGATGAVGKEIIGVLEKRGMLASISGIATSRTALE